MKKLGILISLLFAITIFTACKPIEEISKPEDSSLIDVEEKGTLVIGAYEKGAPMTSRSDDGRWSGFDIELAEMVADKLNVKLEIVPVTPEDAELQLEAGKIDAIWTRYSITEERCTNLEFTKPYINNEQIFVINDKSTVQAVADLKGLILGVQKGSYAEDLLDKDTNFRKNLRILKSYDDILTAMRHLITNDGIDVVLGENK